MAKKSKNNSEEKNASSSSSSATTLDVGTAVWVKDAKHAWVAAEISKVDSVTGEALECAFAKDEDDGRGGGGGGDEDALSSSLANAQPIVIKNAKEDIALRERNTEEDMVKLNYLHEAGVLHNLRRRYARDEIYTYTCLLYTSPSPRDLSTSRMPSSA